MRRYGVLIVALTCLLAAGPLSANSHQTQDVAAWVDAHVKPWLTDSALIAAIQAQNAAHADISQTDIDAADQLWRDELDGDSRPTINAMLARSLSKFLKAKKSEAGGVITEIIVMDDKGLNVGLSDVTSDVWQGDEDKFVKSFAAGKGAMFVDEIKQDESSGKLQSQVSITISDEAGNPIGAITIGIDLDSL